jgi:hypothetical protein
LFPLITSSYIYIYIFFFLNFYIIYICTYIYLFSDQETTRYSRGPTPSPFLFSNFFYIMIFILLLTMFRLNWLFVNYLICFIIIYIFIVTAMAYSPRDARGHHEHLVVKMPLLLLYPWSNSNGIFTTSSSWWPRENLVVDWN